MQMISRLLAALALTAALMLSTRAALWPTDAVGRTPRASLPLASAWPTPLPETYSLVDTWDTAIPTGPYLFHPAGIAVDRNGVVVVAETGNHRLTRASSRGAGPGLQPGQPAQHLGRRGRGPGEFEAPQDVAVSGGGERIYVADTGNRRVQVLSPAGASLAIWPDVGLPRGIAIGPALGPGGAVEPDARVYVSDAAGRRVRVFSLDGVWLADWDAGGTLLLPLGLAVNADGDLAVADAGAQRLVWLDADASEGPSGALVGSLRLDNSAGQGGAPLDVGQDVNGDVFVTVARGLLRFRRGAPGADRPGNGVAADLGSAERWRALGERMSPACAERGCGLSSGCAILVDERENHEGFQRLDLRPDVGLFTTYSPALRWLDRVVVYPSARRGAGISPPANREGWVWPRLCEDYLSVEYRHATDPNRIAAGSPSLPGVGLDSAGWLRPWLGDGRLQDGLHVMQARPGLDLDFAAGVATVITGNQVQRFSVPCLLGNTMTGFPPVTCRKPSVDILDRGQLIRRERTNECRRAEPVPWPGRPEGPCIPDDGWWHTAVGDGGAVATLDSGKRRVMVRTERGMLVAGPLLDGATSAFRSFIDLDYDALGQLWVLAREGALRVFDGFGHDRGEMRLVGPAEGRTESLSVQDDGHIFVLTGDGWVLKYAPEEGPEPTATATRPTTPGPSPRPTRTLSRPTGTARPTLPPRAMPVAAWRVADHAGPGRYRDLAVAPDGRVMVTDGDHDRVLVFGTAAAAVTPPPTATPAIGPCRFLPQKVASPVRLLLGETTEVRLRLDGDCGARHAALDLVVVVDNSCQMSGERLARTREALVALIDAMVLPQDRMAIVSFKEDQGDARLLLPLTADRIRLLEVARTFRTDCLPLQLCLDLNFKKLGYMRSFLFPHGCLGEGRISDGLRAGREALFGPAGRADAGKAMILISPSRPDSLHVLATLSQDPDTFDPPFEPWEMERWLRDLPSVTVPVTDREHALWEIWQLREAGVRVLTTGVGMDSFGAGHPPDEALLAALAWPADGYRPAGTPAELVGVLATEGRELAARLLMQRLVITDRIPANMRLMPGSVRPPAEILPEGGRSEALLRWTFAAIPLTGPPELLYRLEPLQAGLWPTNVEAFADYVDGLDQSGQSIYPVPVVEVIGPETPTVEPTPPPLTLTPSPGPSATVTPTGSPTVTSGSSPTASPGPTGMMPRRLYLPLLRRDSCTQTRRPVDVALVIDSSLSMSGAKLAAAQSAAGAFADLLNLREGGDRAAVIGFNAAASLLRPLTHSRTAIRSGLAALSLASGTRIDLGLTAATAEITGRRARVDADRAIVLLTDGRPTAGFEEAAVAAASQARAAAIATWVIGLGGDLDAAYLARLAGAAGRVRVAPGAADLEAVYRQVASTLLCR